MEASLGCLVSSANLSCTGRLSFQKNRRKGKEIVLCIEIMPAYNVVQMVWCVSFGVIWGCKMPLFQGGVGFPETSPW